MSAENETLRIGLVSDTSLDGNHGVGTYVRDVGGWLSEQGHQVHYIVGPTDDQPLDGITHQPASRNHGVTFNGNRLLIPSSLSVSDSQNLLSELGLDVLHIQMPYAPWFAGRLVAAATTEQIIGTFHILPFDKKARLGAWAVGRTQQGTLQKFNSIVAPSTAAAQFAHWGYKVSPEVIGNPVDTKFYRDAQPLLEYADDHLNIVYIGRLVERKGVQHAISSLQLIADDPRTTRHIRFIIGGSGKLLSDLQKQAKQLEGSNVEIVFETEVDNERKRRLLKSADIALYPATSGESFGIVLTEAMAAEHPIVLAGNNPGYQSVLGDSFEEIGLAATFDPTNHNSMAALIGKYCRSRSAREQLRAHQSSQVGQYDINVIGSKLLERYQK